MIFTANLILIILLQPAHGLPYECSVGLWGSRCDKVCGECEGGPAFCHVHDGRCVNGCGSGFHGARCKKACPLGTHGQYCMHTCGNCSVISPICDVTSGECKGGCKIGFQKPFCKLPCPFNRWGDECQGECTCREKCGCHPISGDCEPCHIDGNPITVVLEVAKTALDIPWVPILSFMGLISAFVLSNFVYWYFWVRVPGKKEVVRVIRGRKPQMNRVEPWDHIREQMGLSTKDTSRPRSINFRTQELGQQMDQQDVHIQLSVKRYHEFKRKILLDSIKADPHHHQHRHHRHRDDDDDSVDHDHHDHHHHDHHHHDKHHHDKHHHDKRHHDHHHHDHDHHHHDHHHHNHHEQKPGSLVSTAAHWLYGDTKKDESFSVYSEYSENSESYSETPTTLGSLSDSVI